MVRAIKPGPGQQVADKLDGKKIKIGAYDFDVSILPDLMAANNIYKELLGNILYDEKEIRIERKIADQTMIEILMHEIIHGIYMISDVDQNENQYVAAYREPGFA